MRNWLAVLAAAALANGCYRSNPEFSCMDSTQCTDGAGGVCQSSGFCSYTDSECGPAGRYGSLAGSLSGKCVDDSSGNHDIDAGTKPIDAPPDAPHFCFGSATSIVKVCLDAMPNTALTIDSVTTIDTTNSPMCATNVVSGGTGYCVVVATDITINATLRGTGPKPLVLVASGSITGNAGDSFIDVSTKRTGATELGAGHDFATCKPAVKAPTQKAGGAGGSFIGKGGDGGDGQSMGGTGGTAGAAITADTVTTLRGGCAGADGDPMGANAGHGGGALFLIAKTKIDFAGTIIAGGEGGLGGPATKGGGGGGGSGGMIGFDAPTIHVANGVYANGGGGGEGLSSGNTVGNDGEDAFGSDAARGGSRASNSGGDGGNGSSSTSNGGGVTASSGDAGAGGGGGGGGVGIIKAPAGAIFDNKVYPAPTP